MRNKNLNSFLGMSRSLEKKRGWSLDRDKEWEVHYEVALYCFGVGDIDLFSLEQHERCECNLESISSLGR